MTKKKPPSQHKPKGRPAKRVIKLDATPEQAARAFFSNVEPPDPARRKPRQRASATRK